MVGPWAGSVGGFGSGALGGCGDVGKMKAGYGASLLRLRG